MKTYPQNLTRLYPVPGLFLLGHSIFTLFLCRQQGTLYDFFWISHVGTFIGGLGACLKNRTLVSTALVSLFVHHLFWLADTLSWLITGTFLLGTTAYLAQADLWEWLKTANHFFSVPILLILVVADGVVKKSAWLWSALLYALLAGISVLFFPPAANVNCAFRPCQGLDTLSAEWWGINAFPLSWYLPLVICWNAVFNYLPVNLLLGYGVPKLHARVIRSGRRPG